jgi:hypothetical protein
MLLTAYLTDCTAIRKSCISWAAQCQTYYGRMAYYYQIRAATGDSFFEQQKNHYLAQQNACH